MISPSSAFSNWLRGTSTFLLMPRMSVNCSRMKSTPNRRETLEQVLLARPGQIGGEVVEAGPFGRAGRALLLGVRHDVLSPAVVSRMKEISGRRVRVRPTAPPSFPRSRYPVTLLPR